MAKDDFSINPKYCTQGWYRDPLPEFDGQRWWDGEEWTSRTRPRPVGTTKVAAGSGMDSETKRNVVQGSIFLAVVAIAIVALVVWGISKLVTGDDDKGPDAVPGSTVSSIEYAPPAGPVADDSNDDTAKDACRNSVKNQLKDPGSAEFRSVEIVSRDPVDGWSIVGEFNANNSFGGKVGFTPFTCSATMKDSETVTATAVLME